MAKNFVSLHPEIGKYGFSNTEFENISNLGHASYQPTSNIHDK
ncbi:hypothetical protein [Flectobacillus major]|jgi:hypothetical protein|nr:hypothetical protein [Flectobacillus major]